MAGNRQHFIPRFLQRGFSNEKNGKYFTNWYRKDCFKENMIVENIGLENKFYSHYGDSSVDKKITENETYSYSRILNSLVDGTYNLDNRKDLAEFIYHMEIRTKNLRENMIDSWAYLGEQLKNRLLDKETLIDYFQRNPKTIKELLQNELNKLPIPASLHEQYNSMFFDNVQLWLPNAAEKMLSTLVPKFEQEIISKIPEIVKKVQLDVLVSSEDKKSNIYKNMHYKVLKTNQSLILGDSIVIFEVSGERKFKPFYESNDDLKCIYIPLDSYSLLYATPNPEDKPNVDGINKAIAQCSFDFFISKFHSDECQIFRSEIGKNAFIVTTEYIDEILSKIITEN
ncbi:DUF4238 domain-containing protein [Escherichia coli]|nr:DUF4238 domain-containing protein [Escherichia coli]EFG1038863.1 DUF4238 domain-containing protein [Escherichia coli]EFG1151094.1 DUF4238 domain-containing protein [Escherichia coli]EHW9888172.1 DUF4238 domain-containing protein [Escherichia coli]EHX1386076.1 DUF4238 domain-containing protein [Escherichia coli]